MPGLPGSIQIGGVPSTRMTAWSNGWTPGSSGTISSHAARTSAGRASRPLSRSRIRSSSPTSLPSPSRRRSVSEGAAGGNGASPSNTPVQRTFWCTQATSRLTMSSRVRASPAADRATPRRSASAALAWNAAPACSATSAQDRPQPMASSGPVAISRGALWSGARAGATLRRSRRSWRLPPRSASRAPAVAARTRHRSGTSAGAETSIRSRRMGSVPARGTRSRPPTSAAGARSRTVVSTSTTAPGRSPGSGPARILRRPEGKGTGSSVRAAGSRACTPPSGSTTRARIRGRSCDHGAQAASTRALLDPGLAPMTRYTILRTTVAAPRPSRWTRVSARSTSRTPSGGTGSAAAAEAIAAGLAVKAGPSQGEVALAAAGSPARSTAAVAQVRSGAGTRGEGGTASILSETGRRRQAARLRTWGVGPFVYTPPR